MQRMKKIATRGLLAFAGLAIIGGGALVVRYWWIGRQVEAETAKLRAAGQPASLIDLAHASTPADRNAATFLRRAQPEMQALAFEIESSHDKQPDQDQDSEADEWNLFSAPLQESMAKAFASHPTVLPLLDAAAACDDFDLERDYKLPAQAFNKTLLDDFGLIKDAARTLRGWALLEASRDRPDDGLRACATLFSLAKLYDRDPFLMRRLMAIAVRSVALQTSNTILQSKPTSSEAREVWSKSAKLDDLAPRIRAIIATERAVGVSTLREMPVPYQLAWLNAELTSFLGVMGAYWDDASSAPDGQRMRTKGNSLAASAAPLTKLMLPAVQAWQDAEVRTMAETRCLFVLLAALDQPEIGDKPAPSIDDLTLPDPLSIDPYNGGKLTLRKVPGGWLIYSVGTDLKDDGGQVVNHLTDVGIAPPAVASKSKATKP
jgi:hypothetical protein